MTPKKTTLPAEDTVRASSLKAALSHIEDALRNLRYGQVTVVVQDGVVVLIERTEKTRLTT